MKLFCTKKMAAGVVSIALATTLIASAMAAGYHHPRNAQSNSNTSASTAAAVAHRTNAAICPIYGTANCPYSSHYANCQQHQHWSGHHGGYGYGSYGNFYDNTNDSYGNSYGSYSSGQGHHNNYHGNRHH